MNIGTQASRVSLAEMEKTFLPELESAASELGIVADGVTPSRAAPVRAFRTASTPSDATS